MATGLTTDEPAWDITAGDAGQYVTAASDAIRLSYYRALIPVAYQRFEAQAAPTAKLDDWCLLSNGIYCSYASPASVRNFGFEYPSSAYTSPVQAPALNFKFAADNILISVNTPSIISGTSSIPPFPPELMKQLEGSGLYTPYLFLRWPLAGATCPVDLHINSTTIGTGTGTLFSCVDRSRFGAPPPRNPPPVSHPALAIATTSLPAATVGQSYRTALTATGGDGSTHRWTLRPGSRLPAGITLSSGGVLSGIPTASGQYPFTVSVDDPATASLTLTVHAVPAPAPASAPVAASAGDGLANTGVPTLPLLALAVALLLAGGVLSTIRKRGGR